MSDVAGVAAISGGLSFLSASAGAIATYMVNRRTTEATIETAESQHQVDITRIEAENQRLRDANREDERRNRQSTYHKHIDALIGIFNLMGREASGAEVDAAQTDYGFLHAGVLLFGPPSVRTAAYEVSEIYNRVWSGMQEEREVNQSLSYAARWSKVTEGLKDEFGGAIGQLTAAMHADITRGVSEDPDPSSEESAK
jgi:hypothetical protein